MRDAAVKARGGGNHRSSNVRWWQAVSAVVPITLVAGAWGVAITASPGSDTIDAKMDDTPSQPDTPAITDVPTDAFEQPMAGQVKKNQSDRHPLAEVEKSNTTPASLKSSPLPTPALDAYRDAEKVMADVKGACKLDWTLVAAIGRVESDHGQYAGSTVDTSGVSSPKIIGIPLDGTNETAAIRDTDDGKYDGDTVWDRAVGPMQFIPSTWDLVGVDGNGDGKKDPNNIYDAALASAVYLCADGEDVSTRDGASEAVFSYNHSTDYVANVLAIAEAYRHGDFSEAPGVVPETDIVPEGDVFDPGSYDDADGDSEPKHKLKPTEFGPAKSESGKSDRLQPMHKGPKKHDKGDDKEGGDNKGDHQQHQVEPASPDGPGTGQGLIQEQHIESVPRGDAKPTDPKGHSKPDNTDGFADNRPAANDNRGSGQGKIEEQNLRPNASGSDLDVDPTEDKAQDDGKAEPKAQDKPRHRAEDKSEVPGGPGVDVRPKHRADVEPTQPKQDAKPTQPKQDTEPAQPKQDTEPAQPKQQAKPTQPKQDAKPTQPKQDAKPTQPKQQAEPAQPKQQAKPTQPKQDTEPAQPKQQAEPAQPKQQAEPAQPKQQAEPAQPKQQAKPAQPKQQAKPTQPKQQAEPTQPEQDQTTVKPRRKSKADEQDPATKTAPAAAAYETTDDDSPISQFLASYSLFWSLPSEASSVDSL